MSAWAETQLKDIALKITKGTTPTTLGFDFTEEGINFIKAESVTRDGNIVESTFARISENTHEALKRSQIYEDDILVSIAGVYLGKIGLVRKQHVPANTNQAVAIVRLDKMKACPEFIKHFLLTPSTTVYLNMLCPQSAQPNLNLTQLGNIKFKLPSPSLQKKIAAILSAYDDLIENNRRRIALLEKMAEEIYREWFVRMRFPGHEQAKFEKGVPDGWRVERVASLVDRKRFGQIYRESELLTEGTVVVIDQSTNEWLGFHEGKAEHEASPERPLILFGDHSCKMQLMIEPFSLAENVIPFSSKREMPIIFLYYLVRSLVETTEYKRHWAELTTKQVFVPADALQKQFDEKVRNLIVMARQLKLVNARLSKAREQLLPRLISGKLDVEKLDIQSPPSMLNDAQAQPSPQPSPGGRGGQVVVHA